MTDEVNLNLIWASTGGTADPGGVKYQTGWVVEIPTFEHFNFVLQNHSKNQLALAEKGTYNWDVGIAYKAGTTTIESGLTYTCVTNHTGQQPSLDTLRNYWVFGLIIGNAAPGSLVNSQGVAIKDVNARVSATSWDGTDLFLSNKSALLQLNTDNAATKNWIVGNVSGELVAIDLGTTILPDSRSLALTEAGTYKIYHEGNMPEASATVKGIAELATDIEANAGTDTARVVTPKGLDYTLNTREVAVKHGYHWDTGTPLIANTITPTKQNFKPAPPDYFSIPGVRTGDVITIQVMLDGVKGTTSGEVICAIYPDILVGDIYVDDFNGAGLGLGEDSKYVAANFNGNIMFTFQFRASGLGNLVYEIELTSKGSDMTSVDIYTNVSAISNT